MLAAVKPFMFLRRTLDETLPSATVQVVSAASLYSTEYLVTVPEAGACQVTLAIFGDTATAVTLCGAALAGKLSAGMPTRASKAVNRIENALFEDFLCRALGNLTPRKRDRSDWTMSGLILCSL